MYKTDWWSTALRVSWGPLCHVQELTDGLLPWESPEVRYVLCKYWVMVYCPESLPRSVVSCTRTDWWSTALRASWGPLCSVQILSDGLLPWRPPEVRCVMYKNWLMACAFLRASWGSCRPLRQWLPVKWNVNRVCPRVVWRWIILWLG